ncbi:HAD-IIB family hydrolase [Clostridium sp. OS1-26]|uniref:HAD-IIB family hydrolase n=1 Tax=Clostridium sp. OS1-26 TaxID=3070681 RepID=UPI0027DFD76C|nr:HAD-IIB family hydrolase [Clostridium sp. OS1-26]WML36890.1 HAD-IIB family hydrolase [Clostridium sp. OS1-26]
MIYFSDLDRTLIYSNKFIGKEKNEICIETLNGEEISYMSPKSIEYLKEILKYKKFIPTTTRSVEQFKRINFKKQGIDFEWSIVSNGANIFYKGQVVKQWNQILNVKLKTCGSLKCVMESFKKEYNYINGISKIRDVDDVFFYIVMNKESFDESNIERFRKFLLIFKWNLYVNGHKIYFLPKVVSKESAVEFVSSHLNEKRFGVIGDSIMDLNMLKLAHKAYIPKGSYIENYEFNWNRFISLKSGFSGTEEILKEILVEKY